MRRFREGFRVLALAALVVANTAAAQTVSGAIAGRVTDSATTAVIANVTVVAVTSSGAIGGTTRTNEQGQFRVGNLANGTYTVEVRSIGHVPRVISDVAVHDATVTVDVVLTKGNMLEQIVVTTTRGATAEKVLDAPASVSVISSEAIETRPSLTTTDHLKGTPGIDISQGGIVQSNVVARGFNNVFSGSLLTLQDYRFAGVPSLRVNVPLLFTGSNEDIDRIEVLLGPASALYGPNAANGVLHVITKSPFNSLGTTLAVDAGERSILRTGLRHATLLNERIGLKISGEYLRGKDFPYTDPGEPVVFPAAAPPGRAGTDNVRPSDVERYTFEGRLDFRGEKTDAVTTIGFTDALSAIELTGSNGAAVIKNWKYANVQQRYRRGRLFAQVFANFSDAGNNDSLSTDGTYLLRSGQPIVDKSRVVAAQLQHTIDLHHQPVTYGIDYIFTNPRTGNTINGRNEAIDNVIEYGAYAQSTVRLAPKWDAVGALRVDKHSEIKGAQISPRAALVYKMSPSQNVRATYNRAFQNPANYAYFLDLVQARNVKGSGFDVRVVGNHGGHEFDRTCTDAAFGDFCMRSPYIGNDATRASAADAYAGLVASRAAAVQTGIQFALAGNPQTSANAAALAAAIVNGLKNAHPGDDQLSTRVAYLLNPSVSVTPGQVSDIGPLKSSYNGTFELGYKGLIGLKGRLSVDAWAQERADVSPPAGVATPSVFFNSSDVSTFLGGNITSSLTPIFQAQGMSQQQATATAQAVATSIVPSLTSLVASAPLGTITFADQTRPDVLFSYFNLNRRITVYGLDLGYDWDLTHSFTIGGTYSWQSENVFDQIVFTQAEGGNGLPYMSNTPKHKATFSVRYQNDAHRISSEVRARYADAFPVNSSLYTSGYAFDDPNSSDTTVTYKYAPVPTTITLDAGVTWRLPLRNRDVAFSLNGTNVLDNRRATFAGTPRIGRLIMTRLRYAF